jgi:zinc transport system substrate-binding protein
MPNNNFSFKITRPSRTAAFAAFAAWAVLSVFLPATAGAGAPSVVVSVKPLHAIVSAVMDGIAQPRLLVKGAASPHDYAMRPSDAAALNDADLIVWIGEVFETFLAKPLEALAGNAEVVTLIELAGADGDPHIWLDPAIALKIAERAAAVLSRLDPDNRDRYQSNTADLAARLDLLDSELRVTLAPVVDRPYLVYHDAYGYFERRYGLTKAGAVTINPQNKPSAKRIVALRETIRASGARCLFGEPQFSAPLLDTLVEGGDARIGVLDPLGAAIPPGPEAYFTLMKNLAEDLRACIEAD